MRVHQVDPEEVRFLGVREPRLDLAVVVLPRLEHFLLFHRVEPHPSQRDDRAERVDFLEKELVERRARVGDEVLEAVEPLVEAGEP